MDEVTEQELAGRLGAIYSIAMDDNIEPFHAVEEIAHEAEEALQLLGVDPKAVLEAAEEGEAEAAKILEDMHGQHG